MDFAFSDLPLWYVNTVAACFGLVVGSFLNVVIYRLPNDLSVVKPKSHCPKCKKNVAWYDNFPVFSYLALRGKCRHCKTKISIQYPLVELLTALLFVASVQKTGTLSMLTFLRDWPFLSMLVAITFIDLEHRIIPDELSLGGLVLGLLTTWAVPEVGWIQSFLGAGIGFGVFYFFAWAYYKWSGKSGLGGGDIKFLAMLGAFLGPQGVFTTILVSSLSGSLVGILYAFFSGRKNVMKLAIPYGPFLVLGALAAYFFGDIVFWFPATLHD